MAGAFPRVAGCDPATRGRFEASERRSDSSINKRILDNTAQMALRTLRAGLMSGVTSPSRPWFRLGLRGSTADEAEFEVKDWLHEVQRRMYEVMRGSNIYRMLDTTYGDLASTAPRPIWWCRISRTWCAGTTCKSGASGWARTATAG